MKKHLLLIFLFVAGFVQAQTPTLINYQGIARDAAGQPMASATLSIRFELLQGTGSPTTAFTEVQTVITNSLGLFTTQIGKQTTIGLNAVNFDAGALQLRVSMDPTGGSSFITLGTQSLVSVPYSMHAASVPATYSNNVLTVGKNTFTLSSGVIYTAGSGISISSNTISNAAPDQTVSINSGNSNVSVSGTYPNFTVSSSPSLSILSPGTMSITNGNSVNINPALSFSNNILTVGAPSNSIVLSSSLAATSIQGGGAAVVSTLATNSFSVNVPTTNITSSTNVIVQGTYPNYTIASTPSLSFASNVLSISGGNSIPLPTGTLVGTGAVNVTTVSPGNFIVNAPTVAITPGTNVNVTGTYPSYVVSATPSLGVGSGSISISGGNSVALPVASITGSGAAVVTGAPNYTVNVNATNISMTNTGLATGVSTVSTNNFNINVPLNHISMTNTSTAVGITTVAANNYNINVPSANITISNSLAAAGVNTTATNNYNINIPSPNISVSNTSAAVGVSTVSANNYNINVPSPNITVSNTFAAVGINTTALNNYNINIPSPNISVTNTSVAVGVSTVSTNNYNINVPSPNISVSNTSAAVGISTVALNNYNINVPSPNITVSNTFAAVGINTTALNNYNINIPSPNISVTNTSAAVGISTVSTNNYNINVPSPNISVTNLSGAASVSTLSTNNYSINIPLPSVAATGLATQTTVGSSFTVGVPVWTYTSATGVIGSGTNTLNITPALTVNANTLTVGSNSAIITGLLAGGTTNYLPKWNNATSLTGTSLLFDDGTNVGIGTTSPAQKLDVTGYIRVGAGTGSANEGWLLATPSPGISSLIAGGRATTDARIVQSNNAPLAFYTNNTERARIDGAGFFGINNTAPAANLDVNGLSKLTNTTLVTGYAADFQNTNASSGQSSGVLQLINTGPRSIGNNAATIQNLTTKSSGSNSTKTGLEIISTGGWAGSGGMYNRGLFVNVSGGADGNYPAILMGGNVGINTTAPDATLNVQGNLDIGNAGTVTGTYASGLGEGNTVTGYASSAIGTSLNVTGFRSHAFGDQVSISALGAVGFGDWQGGATNTLVCATSDQFSARFENGYRFFSDDVLTPAKAVYISTGSGSTGGFLGLGIANPSSKLTIGDGVTEKLTVDGVFGDMNFTDPQASITFPAISGGSDGMITMFASGTTNADRMVIQHSPSFPTYGLQYSDLADKFNFLGNGVPVLTADIGAQRVGVGTSSPSEKFQIENTGSTQMSIVSGAGLVSNISFGITTNHFLGNIRYDNSNNSFNFWTNNTADRLTIASNGFVGIGTSAPTLQFHLNGGSSNNGDIQTDDTFPFMFMNSNSGTGNCGIRFTSLSATDAEIISWSGSYMTLYEGGNGLVVNNGNVGVGTTAPSFMLHVNGTAGKPGGGSWSVASDIRLKKDIHDYTDGLTELMKIRPIWYTYTGEAELPQETFVGVAAQDLQQVAPYMVKEWTYTPSDVRPAGFDPTKDVLPDRSAEKKNYLTVDNSAMTYMIINSIKEQQAQIEALKKQIEEQQKLIEQLLKK
jgi:hypothetical protein